MDFSARQATIDDREAIIYVIRTVFDEYEFTWDPDEWHADLYDLDGHYLSAGHEFWVATSADGEIVGTAALEYTSPAAGRAGQITDAGSDTRIAGCDCMLERVYVLPSARRYGVGGQLVSLAIAAARSAGCRRMEIWSDKRFTAAHRLYTRHGAVIVGDRLLNDPDDSAEWGMSLELEIDT